MTRFDFVVKQTAKLMFGVVVLLTHTSHASNVIPVEIFYRPPTEVKSGTFNLERPLVSDNGHIMASYVDPTGTPHVATFNPGLQVLHDDPIPGERYFEADISNYGYVIHSDTSSSTDSVLAAQFGNSIATVGGGAQNENIGGVVIDNQGLISYGRRIGNATGINEFFRIAPGNSPVQIASPSDLNQETLSSNYLGMDEQGRTYLYAASPSSYSSNVSRYTEGTGWETLLPSPVVTQRGFAVNRHGDFNYGAAGDTTLDIRHYDADTGALSTVIQTPKAPSSSIDRSYFLDSKLADNGTALVGLQSVHGIKPKDLIVIPPVGDPLSLLSVAPEGASIFTYSMNNSGHIFYETYKQGERAWYFYNGNSIRSIEFESSELLALTGGRNFSLSDSDEVILWMEDAQSGFALGRFAVPEPSTLGLALLGLPVFASRYIRNRRRAAR